MPAIWVRNEVSGNVHWRFRLTSAQAALGGRESDRGRRRARDAEGKWHVGLTAACLSTFCCDGGRVDDYAVVGVVVDVALGGADGCRRGIVRVGGPWFLLRPWLS